MLDVPGANAKTKAITDAFADIGVSIETSMPRSRGNKEPLAWEFLVARELKRLADARDKKAVREAVKAGVMFDPEKQPLVTGASAVVYAGDVVQISVDVGTPQARVDTVELVADLIAAGVNRAMLTRLVAKHTHESRAPHRFSGSLVTKRETATA